MKPSRAPRGLSFLRVYLGVAALAAATLGGFTSLASAAVGSQAGAGDAMAAGRARLGYRSRQGEHACRPNLAERLRTTLGAAQLMTVEASDFGTSVAVVETWSREGGCWQPAGGPWPALIGAHGFSDHHREGDGTTPTGIYRIAPTVYGNDPNPGYRGPYHRLVCGDWWDEDPTSPTYNTFQHVPCGVEPSFGPKSEALWTEGLYYPSFAVVEYNRHPVVPYAGSGIFVHAATGAPTLGCVSIPKADLDMFLRWLDPAKAPAIVMAPTSEMEGF